ncbi:hypothetical protein KM043_012056 [Ampulex compressa]|nr:hypothetical protein KM043_012056 [Ampulex compressa]
MSTRLYKGIVIERKAAWKEAERDRRLGRAAGNAPIGFYALRMREDAGYSATITILLEHFVSDFSRIPSGAAADYPSNANVQPKQNPGRSRMLKRKSMRTDGIFRDTSFLRAQDAEANIRASRKRGDVESSFFEIDDDAKRGTEEGKSRISRAWRVELETVGSLYLGFVIIDASFSGRRNAA